MKLQDKLKNIDTYPFHMPGHKRNEKFGIVGSEIDITEIDGFDNLHSPSGAILEIENKLQKIYKSKKSYISVNGSSCGILAAIHSVCEYGDKIIIAKNCHKSVYNACLLLRLKVVYVEPQFDMSNGFYTRLSQEKVDEVISKNPDAKAIVITSPTYEGYISDIEYNIPKIVDSAHGAHLGISYFSSYPKGDIVVSSLHKTLPALTQSAVINVYNEEYIEKVKRYMDIFETTSPSYIIMNSIDVCCDYILENKKDFGIFYEKICNLRLVETNNIRILYNDDISKIVLSCASADINGFKLANTLREKYKIEVEMSSDRYVILMLTIGDTDEGFDRLKKAIEEIDEGLIYTNKNLIKKPPIEKNEFTIFYSNNGNLVSTKEAIGKISNEFIYAYPPDIPIVVPNEIIKKETIDYISNSLKNNVNIISDSGELPNMILTKEQ